MKFFKKPIFWGIAYGAVLTAFTAYVLLDAFVIPRTYVVLDSNPAFQTESSVQTSSQTSSSGTANTTAASTDTSATSSSSSATSTSNSYSDGNITIKINSSRENGTNIYVADIKVTDVKYLKTALANNSYGKNITQKTSEIASANNAILAINGDYYGVRNGYVIRNGVLLRDTSSDSSQQDLVISKDGSFSIVTEGSVSASDLLSQGASQVLSFGPALVQSSQISVSENDEVGQAMSSNPRTAIGMIDKLHYVMVVSDGRTSESTGLSLYQLATFMKGLGCSTAYNLDGGGSSTMYFQGNIVNKPTTNGNNISERSVSDIVYIG